MKLSTNTRYVEELIFFLYFSIRYTFSSTWVRFNTLYFTEINYKAVSLYKKNYKKLFKIRNIVTKIRTQITLIETLNLVLKTFSNFEVKGYWELLTSNRLLGKQTNLKNVKGILNKYI